MYPQIFIVTILICYEFMYKASKTVYFWKIKALLRMGP